MSDNTADTFSVTGIEKALEKPNTDVRIFGKPTTRPYRQMGVALVYDKVVGDMDALRAAAEVAADCIRINQIYV